MTFLTQTANDIFNRQFQQIYLYNSIMAVFNFKEIFIFNRI